MLLKLNCYQFKLDFNTLIRQLKVYKEKEMRMSKCYTTKNPIKYTKNIDGRIKEQKPYEI